MCGGTDLLPLDVLLSDVIDEVVGGRAAGVLLQ
jgi:hypothetical protein